MKLYSVIQKLLSRLNPKGKPEEPLYLEPVMGIPIGKKGSSHV